MASLGLLADDELDRQRLVLLAGEAGHTVMPAGRIQEAVEILREYRPKAMLVVDGPRQDAAAAVREILRVAPLMPVVVALRRRDANRAVALMRLGAAEVVSAPWSREALQSCLSKTLRCQGTAFSVVYAPPRSTLPYYVLAVLVFFGAAFGYLALQRQERLRHEVLERKAYWDMPYQHPSGLAYDDKSRSLWAADWFTQSLYEHPVSDLSIRRIVHFPAQMPVSVAFAMDSVWSVTAQGAIVRHMRDASLTPVETYADAAAHTAGIAYDGLYLWTCEPARRLIYKRLTDASLTVVATYRYPGGEPVALVFDGKSLWSLDAGSRELVRHNLERPDETTGRIPLPEYRDGGYKPRGLAWDGTRFWTLAEKLPKDSGPARIFEHADLSAMRMVH